MATTAPVGNAAHDWRLNLDELHSRLTRDVSLALIVASAAAWWTVLPGGGFRWQAFVVFFSLFLAACAAGFYHNRSIAVARAILLIAPVPTLSLALELLGGRVVPYFAVLAVIANAALSPALGFASAALCSAPLCALLPADGYLCALLALLWIIAGLEWISSRALHTALGWAWNSQQRASRLLDELRERQGKLNQTLEALTEATRRLERTGYELAVARLRADEARQLKERFAANISHELRTPLNLIMGFAEMMFLSPEVYGDMAWPEELRRDVRRIYQSSRQLLGLVNDILDLSRIDAARMPVHKELADLADVIGETLEATRDLLRGRPLDLQLDCPAGLQRFMFDRARIRQVLQNLLSNAARFTERGTVAVTVTADQHEVTVSVADTGTGMPPQELARVFDEFYQVDMSLRRQGEGAGLGLAISKQFVELHGGRIWAQSQVGKGSTFSFSLPLSPEAALSPLRASGRAQPQKSPVEPAVVVVDKDPDVGALLGRHVPGYRILQAQDLPQAALLTEQKHPQAVVVNMPPGEQEWQATEHCLDALPTGVPVLFCSLPSQSWLAASMGARACLTKPITREGLLAALEGIGQVRDVLVVDDDRGFLQLLTRFLTGTDGRYTSRVASEGAEGLARAKERRPDAILLDLIMPGMDGFQFMEALRSDTTTCDIPVIVVTASSHVDSLIRERTGVVGVGRRGGLDPSQVISYLQALLDLSRPDYGGGTGPGPRADGPGRQVSPESPSPRAKTPSAGRRIPSRR